MKKTIFILSAFLFTLSGAALGQDTYKLVEGTTCEVTGTSTLHDWTAKVSEVSGEISLGKDFTSKKGPSKGTAIQKASITFAVKSMDGGRGSTMNDKIYNAFDAENNPNITFVLGKASVAEVKADGEFVLDVTGDLSMAGNTQSISFQLTGTKTDDGKIRFTGEKKLDMTTFGMETPSAMFGQIVTGKDVTVKFNLLASK